MPAFFGAGGAWKAEGASSSVGAGGANKALLGIWVGAGGAWKVVRAGVQLFGTTLAAFRAGPGTTTATLLLNSTGAATLTVSPGGTGAASYSWLLSGSASDYEARLTVTSGTIGGDPTSTWLGLGTARVWANTRSLSGTTTGTGTLEIRHAGSGSVLASVTVTIASTVT